MKIIAGVHHGYDGRMRLDGREVHFRSARDALAAGIGMVHQELSIVPDLTVAENVFLGTQPVTRLGIVDWRRHDSKAARAARQPRHRRRSRRAASARCRSASSSSSSSARVLFSGARIIILDEPTSALSPPEVERLFAVLRRLRESGRSIVFISHFLDDILDDLRQGHDLPQRPARSLTRRVTQEIDKAWIIERMIGTGHEELEESYLGEITLASRARTRRSCWRRTGLSLRAAPSPTSRFKVTAGEVLGVYGFMGCGQIELSRALFGKLQPRRGRACASTASRSACANTARRQAGRHRLRAGEPARDAVPPTSRSTRTSRSASSSASRAAG